MKEFITGAQFCEMVICASDALELNKQPINELNVFPVPDGDTGTNMSLTMSAAAAEMRKRKFQRIDEAADKVASALLRGARGNSGVILSLLFRGIAKNLKGCEKANAAEFAAAMCDGVDAAYKAVMKPAEGTILTVSRVGSKAAFDCALESGDAEIVLETALSAANEALALTMEQNPVLKRAGVIDAGGKGYCIIIEAMLRCLKGELSALAEAPKAADETETSHFEVFETGEIEFAFDTVFIVRKAGKDIEPFRAYLDSIGDSLVISEDDEIFKVHVHTNIPGEALTESQKYGELELAKIENMRTQHEELVSSGSVSTNTDAIEATEPEPEVAPAEKQFGVVAVCTGEGMSDLFRELGADRIVYGGQTLNPSTEDILKEINRVPAETVFVFPNNKNIIMAAEQCIRICEKKVVVIPTKTMPQGISALLNFDTYCESEEQLSATFNEAIAGVHTAQITYAARNSDFDGHEIHEGEYLGLLDGGLIGNCTDVRDVIAELCNKAQELDPSFISVYYGEGVDYMTAESISQILGRAFPDAEVSLVDGGQPVYYYIISIE